MRSLIIGWAFLCVVGFGAAAQAQVMNFESFDLESVDEAELCGGGPGDGLSFLEENGLRLTPSESEWCLFNEELSGDSGLNGNGGNFFGFCGSCEIPFFFELVRLDGQPFSLVSIDLSNLDDQQGGDRPLPVETSTEFLLVGYPAGGGAPVERSFEYVPGVWDTFAVSGLNDMQRVEIVFPEDGPDSAFDNIVTRAGAASIPVAGPFGLLTLLTLMLLVGWRRLGSMNRNAQPGRG